MKGITYITMVLSFTLMISMPLWADVPAPPANQMVGVNDGVFNDMVEADCRFCHENPDQFPVEDETIPDRHHLLYGTVIPNPTDAPYGTPGELFACLSCHAIDTSSGSNQFLIERDCQVCHMQDSFFELTVHHRTDEALGNLPQGPDCKACHGSLVDNMEDGHFISAEPATDGTPKRSAADGLPLNSEGKGAGACDYCHSTGTGDPTIPGVDSATGILVYSNQDTHHETGFWGGVGAHGFVCFWCHDFNRPFEEQIRVCENCHGRDSLHNIQLDSDGDGVINPGVELPGYGHVGDPDDCWGCHAFSPQMFSASSAPDTGPVIPNIGGISASVLAAGVNTVVTISGAAFTNNSSQGELSSNITLSPDHGTSIELIPDLISENLMTVTIPGTLTTGNYTLRVVKLDKFSNPAVISIKPGVTISDAICDNGTVNINGSGFSGFVDAENSGALITGTVTTGKGKKKKTTTVGAEVISWTDTRIEAQFDACPSEVTVDSVFGSATSEVGGDSGSGKPPKPCKGKGCNK